MKQVKKVTLEEALSTKSPRSYRSMMAAIRSNMEDDERDVFDWAVDKVVSEGRREGYSVPWLHRALTASGRQVSLSAVYTYVEQLKELTGAGGEQS